MILRNEVRGQRPHRRRAERPECGGARGDEEERPYLRLVERRVDGQEDRDDDEPDLGHQDQPAPVDRIRDRAADERERQERNQLAERDQPDEERRARELVDLVRDRDEADLAPDQRDRLADPQAAKLGRFAQRPDVDRHATEESADAAGPIDERPAFDVPKVARVVHALPS